jgi:Multicopper oxidase
VRVIMQWYDVPDGPVRTDGRDFKNKYVFHCHNLEHEDHMMMGEIEVQRRL